MARDRLFCGMCLAVAVAILAVPRGMIPDSYPNPWDQDEAVFLSSARAVVGGAPLYSETFCAQPPVQVDVLVLGFRLFGDLVAVGRGLELLFGIAGVVGVARVAWQLAGPQAAGVAAVALAGSFLYARQSWCCEAAMPAVALSVLGLAAALESAARRSVLWAAVGGCLFAAAAMSKVFAVPLLAAAAAALLLAPHAGGGWRVRYSHRFWGSSAAAAAAFLAGVAALAAAHPFDDLYDQAVRFHLTKADHYSRQGNLSVLAHNTLREVGTAALATVGLAAGLPNRRLRTAAGWAALWLGVAAAFTLTHKPLHPHHIVLVLPPMAVLAGVGAAAVAAGRGLWVSVLAAAMSLVCVDRGIRGIPLGSECVTVGPVRNFDRLIDRPMGPAEADVIRVLRERTGPDDPVVTDDPKLAYWAGRPIPPGICDPSIERIEASSLSFEAAVRAARSARAVVFWRGWLEKIPGFADWVRAEFRPILDLGEGRVVYLRK